MALEEFEKKPLSQQEKRYIQRRSIMDFGMGIVWVIFGFFLIFLKYFGTNLQIATDPVMTKIFGGLCVAYGAFRIYRAVKKNYFIGE